MKMSICGTVFWMERKEVYKYEAKVCVYIKVSNVYVFEMMQKKNQVGLIFCLTLFNCESTSPSISSN